MQTAITYDLSHILNRVANGDEKAFAQLYHSYSDKIYGVALAYGKTTDFAEEMVQEVFLKIWLKRQSLAELESFENYLFILARNQILNQLKQNLTQRTYRERLASMFRETSTTPEDELLFKEAGNLVSQALDLLPPQQKRIYQLARQEGLPLGEIALQLGLSRNTVRNHLAKAMQTVRDYLRTHSRELVVLLYCYWM